MLCNEDLKKLKVAITCLIARALDRFLFSDVTDAGVSFHQALCRKKSGASRNPDQADKYVAAVSVSADSDWKIGDPILLGDLKLDEMYYARRESTAHCPLYLFCQCQ